MKSRKGILAVVVGLFTVGAMAAPAAAIPQLGVGLHYLYTVGEITDQDGVSANDFSVFGSITIPVVMFRIEGDLELIPDYLGSDNMLWQPSVYGILPLGLLYGGLGMGIGNLDGEWASNPWYGLRVGMDFGLAGLALDGFVSYRIQSANFGEGLGNFDLDALTLGAQVKFGGN